MGLAGAWRSEHQEVLALFDPCITLSKGLDMGFGDHGQRREVKAIEALIRWELRFEAMSRETALCSLRHLQIEQGGEESSGGPAFPIGLDADRFPHALDGRHAEFRQQDRQARRVRVRAGVHAASTRASYAASAGNTTDTVGSCAVRGRNRALSASRSGKSSRSKSA